MQQIADLAWADAKCLVHRACIWAIGQRRSSLLNPATSAYESVLQSSKDEQLNGRAQLGLARIYEMQNKLDKAREEYGKVTGAYAKYAQVQVERLTNPMHKTPTPGWKRHGSRSKRCPSVPAHPARRQSSRPGEMSLPTGPAAGPKTEDTKAANDAFDNLLKSLRDDSKKGDSPDRYKDGQKPADGTTPPAKDAAPPAGAEKGETKPAEKPAEKSGEVVAA